ncbi:MAG: saccharopine dehydrogenase C-terminal domain-containing protein, partial [Chitinophagaceae bacterium]|nr:saccharopine dehydrogenase C-terminal domain-containing protein [Chitinophagaceae bacterium]
SDLSAQHLVTAFDVNETNLSLLNKRNPAIKTQKADLTDYGSYLNMLAGFDMAVTAVPGFMGYKTLEAVINCGKNVADISFFPEDVLQLDKLAKQKVVTVITDVGVAPGMSNLILGYYNELMKVNSFECYVGGLPQKPQPPFYYKAPFSPVDVIQEYIRPARLQEKGKIVTKPALTEREIINFDGVGKLEAFNTDGLRSLLFTMSHIPDMKEKTLRYPGHIDLIVSLKQAGFFESHPVDVNGIKISPLEFSSKILINEWKLGEEEEELTIMRVIVNGETNSKPKTIEYNLLDRYDAVSKTSSMARTTGYTCTAAVHLIEKGLFNEKGVFPPELVGKHRDCFEFVVEYLRERGVVWKYTEQ